MSRLYDRRQQRPAGYQYKYKSEEVRESYLSDNESGLATALRDALKALFSEPRLPDNPYYYLAATLTAHVDQSVLWKTPSGELMSVYDAEGGVEPLFGELQLCKIFNFSHCCGLPHMLRVVSKDAASFLHEALVDGLPDCLFHAGPLSWAVQAGGGAAGGPPGGPGSGAGAGGSGGGGAAAGSATYSMLTLCSVQGSSALWRPSLLEFPELEIRCDVTVRGEKLDEAVRQFVGLIVRDVRELHQIPVYFVDGVAIMDGPAAIADAERELFRRSYQLDAVLDDSAGEFEKTAARLVLGGKVVQVNAVLLVEGPSDPSDSTIRKLRYEVARKTYFFHYHSDLDARPTLTQPMSHFGSNPYDALYSGYFLDVAAARQYCGMYIATDREPYHKDNLGKQMELLRASIDTDLQHGNSRTAWRHLLLLVLLHDPTTVKPGPLEPESFPSLEDLALKAPRMLGNQVGWLLATIPNLLRINNSAASVLEGIVRELEAISIAAQRWPAKLADARAAAAEAGAAGPPATGDSRRTVRTPEVSRAMVAWLSTFDMETRLLRQLLGLRERITLAIGSGAGMFSGISFIAQRLLSELPSELPALPPAAASAAAAAALTAAQPKAALLCHLLNAASLTVSHGFVTRCADVRWALSYLDIPVANDAELSTMRTIAAGGHGEGAGVSEGAPPPSWVLDVNVVRSAQVRAGLLAERVSTEGIMLQYAVDSKLDEMLATVWQAMTDPPLLVNPYPKLLHLLRSQAARMDLWHEEPEEAISSYLVNELTLLRPPSFIYEARLPPNAPSRRGGGGGTGGAGPTSISGASGGGGAAAGFPRAAGAAAVDDDDTYEEEEVVGYGSYAAVTCVDVRALSALRVSLGTVLAERHWQSGAYQGEVVPALVGDVAISNALRLDRDLVASGAAAGVGAGHLSRGDISRHPAAPFEHPRLYGLESEEHHLVGGPKRREAAQAFAREVVSDLQQLHVSSPHIVFSVDVVGGSAFSALDLWKGATAAGSAGGGGDGASADGAGGVGGVVPSERGMSYDVLERLHGELVEAALRVPEGRLLASVVLYVSPAREVTYVPLTRHLLFQYRKALPPLVPHTSSVTSLMPGPRRPTTAEQQAQLWTSAVYQRVFMSEYHAATWYSWNSDRGDPALPYHYKAMVAAIQDAAPKLEAAGKVLQLQRSLFQAAIAVQDHSAVYQLSRVFGSAAQELKCLQEVHLALVDLLSTEHEALRPKLDNERVRRLFLTYVQRVRAALTSPRYNYFSGLGAAVPGVLSELQEEVLASFRLNKRMLELMQQLAVWTHCCEISVAEAATVVGQWAPGGPQHQHDDLEDLSGRAAVSVT